MQNLYPTCCVLLPISFQGSLFFTKLSYICDLGTYLLATFICVINLPNLFSTYAYLYLTQIGNTTRILAFLVSSFHFNFYVDIWHELANYIVISLNFEIEAEGVRCCKNVLLCILKIQSPNHLNHSQQRRI